MELVQRPLAPSGLESLVGIEQVDFTQVDLRDEPANEDAEGNDKELRESQPDYHDASDEASDHTYRLRMHHLPASLPDRHMSALVRIELELELVLIDELELEFELELVDELELDDELKLDELTLHEALELELDVHSRYGQSRELLNGLADLGFHLRVDFEKVRAEGDTSIALDEESFFSLAYETLDVVDAVNRLTGALGQEAQALVLYGGGSLVRNAQCVEHGGAQRHHFCNEQGDHANRSDGRQGNDGYPAAGGSTSGKSKLR